VLSKKHTKSIIAQVRGGDEGSQRPRPWKATISQGKARPLPLPSPAYDTLNIMGRLETKNIGVGHREDAVGERYSDQQPHSQKKETAQVKQLLSRR
jgi:hypothetical protein